MPELFLSVDAAMAAPLPPNTAASLPLAVDTSAVGEAPLSLPVDPPIDPPIEPAAALVVPPAAAAAAAAAAT